MSKLNPYFRILFLISLFFLFASCTTQAEPGATETNSMAEEDDHSDDDHHDDDEDHGDDDHHDDEDHGDEDHDDEHREHGAHEHGAAELTVALIDGQAEIALETPAFNLVGFEYAPNSDEEVAAVADATANLEKGEWFTLSDAAGCTLNTVSVESTMAEEDHSDEDHDEEHDDEHGDEDHKEEGETHSSFFATYIFDCSSLEELAELDATALFNDFPNFEDVDAQWLNETQQSAVELSKDNPVLSFE